MDHVAASVGLLFITQSVYLAFAIAAELWRSWQPPWCLPMLLCIALSSILWIQCRLFAYAHAGDASTAISITWLSVRLFVVLCFKPGGTMGCCTVYSLLPLLPLPPHARLSSYGTILHPSSMNFHATHYLQLSLLTMFPSPWRYVRLWGPLFLRLS